MREREANVFAATLLMPENDLRAASPGMSVDDLARTFGVSSVAMAWRLYHLGLGPQPAG